MVNQFEFVINTENKAFGTTKIEAHQEVARMLRNLADTLEDGRVPNYVHDNTGDVSGRVKVN